MNRLLPACAFLLLAVALAPAAVAGGAAGEVIGEVLGVDGRVMTLRADDGATRQLEAPPLLRIVTPSHHEMSWSGLRAGQRVRVTTGPAGNRTHPIARSIVVLRDVEPGVGSGPIAAAGGSGGGAASGHGIDSGREAGALEIRWVID